MSDWTVLRRRAATRTSLGVSASQPVVARRQMVLEPRRIPWRRNLASMRLMSRVAPRLAYARVASLNAALAAGISPCRASRSTPPQKERDVCNHPKRRYSSATSSSSPVSPSSSTRQHCAARI